MSFDHTRLHGTHVALVTPFHADGEVDVSALKRLLDMQIEGGTEGVMLAGTTGEGTTLLDHQLETLVRTSVEHVQGRMLVTVGTGSNSTLHAIELTQMAKELGADAGLSVGPFYNKPTQEGYYRHFSTIAETVDLPLIIYNVPGRTAGKILRETIVRLAEIPNIVGTKESTGDMMQMSYLVRDCPNDFVVLAGDDYMGVPSISVGAKGVVSVCGNQAPRLTSDMTRAALRDDMETARALHMQLLSLMDLNFIETNPIPVKAALSMMGVIEENYHLPMTPICDSNRMIMREALVELELL